MGPSLSPLKGRRGKERFPGLLLRAGARLPQALRRGFQHLIVPEPNNAIAVARNLSGPRRGLPAAVSRAGTIDLDCALAGGHAESRLTYGPIGCCRRKRRPGKHSRSARTAELHFGRIPTQTASNVGSLYCLYTSKTQGMPGPCHFSGQICHPADSAKWHGAHCPDPPELPGRSRPTPSRLQSPC